MLSNNEAMLLSHLRENSRKSLAVISKETGIPASTLFEMLKRLEQNVIHKHVTLMDFSKIGYNVKVHFVVGSKNRQELKDYLVGHENINSLSSIATGQDFFCEGVFKNLKDWSEFKEKVEEIGINKFEENYVLDEVKREGFNQFY